MKAKNIIISALAGFLFCMLVLFMYGFVNRQNAKYEAVVSLDKIHIIYFQFENPITVVVPGVPQGKVVVKCAETPVNSLGGTKYSIPVTDAKLVDKMVHVSISVLNNGKEELIESITYWILRPSAPEPTFANHTYGTISVQEAINTDSLYISMPGFYYDDFSYKVTKFRFIIPNQEPKATTVIEGTGNKIKSQMIEAIKLMKKGDKIIVSDIFATYIDPITKQTSKEHRIPKAIDLTVE